MGSVTVTQNVQWRNHLGQFSNKISRAGEGAIEEASREGSDLAAVFAPKKTTALAGGIHPIGSGAAGGWATGNQKYAIPQEEGAAPHVIVAHGKALAGADFGPVKRVLHPGNPATHFMRRAYEIVAPKLTAKIRARI